MTIILDLTRLLISGVVDSNNTKLKNNKNGVWKNESIKSISNDKGYSQK